MIDRRFLIPGSLLLCFFAGSPVGAEGPPPLLVGRVSAVDGAVAVRPSAVLQPTGSTTSGDEWTDAAVNDPVAAGMSVRSAAGGRAVLRIGTETIALAPATEIDLAQFDVSGTRVVLQRGRIGVRRSPLEPAGNVEIDIPRGAVRLLTAGDYDITAGDESTPARIAVFGGSASVVGKGLDTTIAAGSARMLSGADPVVAIRDGAAADAFAASWQPAGGADPGSPSLRHVSPEMTGRHALDGYGTWETVDGYGAVWFPQTLPADWAPYQDGHWRWIAPWGWSWIDDMPWGFAPSHYGRWARIRQLDPLDPSDPDLGDGTSDGAKGLAGLGERWGWVPGKLVAHPVYMPAGVAFLGTAGIGISYPDAFGPAVAWFPLAPGEAYWPGYTSDLDTIRQINQSTVADVSAIGPGADGEPPAAIVNGDYRNRRFASVVPRAVFTGGRPVASALLQLPAERLDNAPLLGGSPQIAPAPPPAVAVATAAHQRWARAMRTLAHIMPRHGRLKLAARLVHVRPAQVRGRIALVLSRRSRWSGGRLVRPHFIAVAASRAGRQRVHLAAHRVLTR